MNLALTVSDNRVAPCFPGVNLWVTDPNETGAKPEVISTVNWPVHAWTHELSRHDVTTMLCAGIDRFLWGALQGYGIQVLPNVTGTPESALKQWRRGNFAPAANGSQAYPFFREAGAGRRRRFRGGR